METKGIAAGQQGIWQNKHLPGTGMRTEMRAITSNHRAEAGRGHSGRWNRAGAPEKGKAYPGGLTPMKARMVPFSEWIGLMVAIVRERILADILHQPLKCRRCFVLEDPAGHSDLP